MLNPKSKKAQLVRHLHPALSQGEQYRRKGPPWISNGGLRKNGTMHFGAESGVWAINAFQRGEDQLSEKDDEEILRRIEREGTAGAGERLG